MEKKIFLVLMKVFKNTMLFQNVKIQVQILMGQLIHRMLNNRVK